MVNINHVQYHDSIDGIWSSGSIHVRIVQEPIRLYVLLYMLTSAILHMNIQ